MSEMELMYQNAKMFYEMQQYETAYNLCEDLIKAGCVKAYTLKALIISENQEKESLDLLKKAYEFGDEAALFHLYVYEEDYDKAMDILYIAKPINIHEPLAVLMKTKNLKYLKPLLYAYSFEELEKNIEVFIVAFNGYEDEETIDFLKNTLSLLEDIKKKTFFYVDEVIRK